MHSVACAHRGRLTLRCICFCFVCLANLLFAFDHLIIAFEAEVRIASCSDLTLEKKSVSANDTKKGVKVLTLASLTHCTLEQLRAQLD